MLKFLIPKSIGEITLRAPLVVNQVFKSAIFPLPSHWTLRFEAEVVKEGAVMSIKPASITVSIWLLITDIAIVCPEIALISLSIVSLAPTFWVVSFSFSQHSLS